MTSPHLASLPKELLAHIAGGTNASSVLSLSRVCRATRDACYDSLVFRRLLVSNQTQECAANCLDMQALAGRCGKDASAWARYALADERAWELAVASEIDHRGFPIAQAEPWLPALFLVKHPLVSHPGFRETLMEHLRHQPRMLDGPAVICLVMTILSTKATMGRIAVFVGDTHNDYHQSEAALRSDPFSQLSLLVLGALWMRHALLIRRAAWPFDDAAIVPCIALPTTEQIPLAPLNASYVLPLPFTHADACREWARHHTNAMRETEIADGEWCGYFASTTHLGYSVDAIDPPMTNINFVVTSSTDDRMDILAKNGTDGHGFFTLRGRLENLSGLDAIRCVLVKEYTSPDRPLLEWYGHLTPFGLVGSTNRPLPSSGSYGLFWLWKKSWTKA